MSNLKDQVIGVDEDEATYLRDYVGDPRRLSCLPIAAIIARRNELKATNNQTFAEANFALMMELRTLNQDPK